MGPIPPDLIPSVPSNPIASTSIYLYIFLASFADGVKRTKAHISRDTLSFSAQTENRVQRRAFLRRRRPTQTRNWESVEIGSDLRRSESVRFLSLFASGFRFVGVVIWFSVLLCLDLFLDFLNLWFLFSLFLLIRLFFFVSVSLSSLRFSLLFDCLFFLD